MHSLSGSNRFNQLLGITANDIVKSRCVLTLIITFRILKTSLAALHCFVGKYCEVNEVISCTILKKIKTTAQVTCVSAPNEFRYLPERLMA